MQASDSRTGLLANDDAKDDVKVDGADADAIAKASELDSAFTYDCCFVLEVGDAEKSIKVYDREKGEKVKMTEQDYFKKTTADLVTRLEDSGLRTALFYSVQKDEIYVRVGASELRLQQEADRIEYDLQLDHRKCLELGQGLGVRLAQATADPDTEVSETDWLNLFGKYDQLDPEHAYRQELYLRYNLDDETNPHYNSFFTAVDRIKLTVGIIEADEELGGAGLSISKAQASDKHSLLAFFPLHDDRARDALMEKWFKLSSTFKGPLQGIRNYFGESIAYYFAFLSFYNRALVMPAIIGLGMFVWQLVDERIDVDGIALYAFYVSMWASVFLEMWKRHEAKYSVRWGMTKFKQKEQPRPEFRGEWKPSPINGRKEEIFPIYKKIMRMMASQSVIWTLIMVVIASVVGVFLLRNVLVKWDQTMGTYLTAFINALQIQILNAVYGATAHRLNDYENHRTDTEYMDALIAKAFVFKFVNSFNTLIYIGFFKRYDSGAGGCLNGDCLAELRQQLGTIFVTLIVINNLLEVGIPYIKNRLADRKNRQAAADGSFVEKSEPEKQFELEEYESTFDDFDELIVQYGFVTLFVVAFPLTPLLALINNTLETRVDATKLCKLTRRPEPRGASDIGTWGAILSIVGTLAVVTNVALVAFASPSVREDWGFDAKERVYFFVAAEHFILLIKFAIDFFIPDQPYDYITHVARQEYVVNVLINGMEEDDDDGFLGLEGKAQRGSDFDWSRVADKMRSDGHDHRPSIIGKPPNLG